MAGLTFSSVPLIKAVATGNDFVMVDLLSHGSEWRTSGAVSHPRAHWAKAWCDRHFGLGADGALFLEMHPEHAFAWDFYNSDGSKAEMCGNAARAASLYYHRLSGKTSFCFLTRAGVVEASVHGPEDIEVGLEPVAAVEWTLPLPLLAGDIASRATTNSYTFVRVGVPHAVVEVYDLLNQAQLRSLAYSLKREARFSEEGTNVTFVTPFADGHIKSVTFERGVEDFTLACGTGAVAAAFSQLKNLADKRSFVDVPGGQLRVDLNGTRPKLRGHVTLIAETRWAQSPP